MGSHDHDAEERALRPKGAALDQGPAHSHAPEDVGHAGAAVGAGRFGVLGAEELLQLQRSAGNAGVTGMIEEQRSPVLDVVSGGGRPLEPEVRADMEARLGHDFSDVRVHDDGAAHASAQAVQAHAYTVGSNVVFQRDAYDPSSTAGRTTLAHELTHVVQQRQGDVDGTSVGGGIKVSDPSDRFEREASATAERAMAMPAAPVQRQAEEEPEEEPTAQGLFVQRQEEEPEEEPAE